MWWDLHVDFYIEGADFAVLALAIHTALLVFKKDSDSSNEGGLYKYRYSVYGLVVLVPIFMAGIAFINDGRKSYYYI